MFIQTFKKACCNSNSKTIHFKIINKIETTCFNSTKIKNFSTGDYLNEKSSEDKLQTSSYSKIVEDTTKHLTKKKINYEVEEKDFEAISRIKKRDIMYPYKGPVDKLLSVVRSDLKSTGKDVVEKTTGLQVGEVEHQLFPRETDILVIGGNALGVMTAFEIRNRFPHGPKVVVVDADSNYPHFSTNLGQGLLMQQQFIEEEEIQMSQYCAEFLHSFHRHTQVNDNPEFRVSFEPLGGLILADEANSENLIKKTELLNCHSRFYKILNNKILKEKFPWLNLNNVLLGSLGLANEGIFDPWAFLNGIKCKAFHLGVEFVTGEVVDFVTDQNSVAEAIVRLPGDTYNSMSFCYCVLASGMETSNIMRCLNNLDISPFEVELPLVEKKRYEYCLYNPDGPGMNTPIIFDSDGTYFRREGLLGHYVAGVTSIPNDENEENEIYNVFDNKVKPFLMNRIPQYEKYELVKCWVDKYDTNTANEIGVIGHLPGEPRFLFASGFAVNGLTYAPAVGRALLELMFYSGYQTINLSKFHIENLYRRQHMEAEQKRRALLESEKFVALNS